MVVSMANHVKFTTVVNIRLLLQYIANFHILAINIEVKYATSQSVRFQRYIEDSSIEYTGR